MPRIQTYDVSFPAPGRAAAVAAALRAAGWDPDAEGTVNLTLLEDVLMIVGAGGDAYHVAAYLHSAARERDPAERPVEAFAPLAEAVVRAAGPGDESRPAV